MFNFSMRLFWKFTIAIICIVIVFASINAYLIWADVQSSLEKESEKKGMFISENLSNQLINPLLYEDYVTTQTLLDNVIKLEPSVAYVFLIGADGEVKFHTFKNSFPDNLLKVNNNSPADSTNIVLIQDTNENRIIRDIAVPIFKANLGILRVGISEESIGLDVQHTILHFWFMVGFFLLLGIIGAFIFSYFITKPINLISTTVERFNLDSIGKEDSSLLNVRKLLFNKWQYLFRAKDEIDVLLENFRKMVFRLKNAYTDLEAAQFKLIESEKMASIGTISAGIAHEINNPLSGVKNAIRRIKNQPQKVEQNRAYFNMIESAIERIHGIINQLLSFSRRGDFHFDFFDVEIRIKKILILISHQIEKHNIEVILNIEKKEKILWGSPNHIDQIFINLFLNSIDTITESSDSGGQIRISVTGDSEASIINFEDNGAGIPETELKKIFDPFYTTKEVGKGTGLGLAVIKNIISAHKAEIKVDNKQSGGVRFTICLPKKKEG